MGPGSRKLLAVLAAGVVLAGGGVTTLAAWQDETYDQAPLRLTRFALEQNVGPEWTAALPSTTPGVIDLSVINTTNLLTPGGALYAWVGLRVADGSTGGTVTMSGASLTGDMALAPLLTYQAAANVIRSECRAGGAAGTPLIAASSALTTGATTTFHLDASAGGAGPAVGVCMRLVLQDGIAKTLGAKSITPVWRFSAVSDA